MGIISTALALITIIIVIYYVYNKLHTGPSNVYEDLQANAIALKNSLGTITIYRPSILEISIILICFIAGIILGVFAFISSKKAKIEEMENTIQKTGKILGFLGILLNSLIIVVYIVDVILRYNNGTSLYDVTFGNPFFVFGLFIIFICCLSGSSRRRW